MAAGKFTTLSLRTFWKLPHRLALQGTHILFLESYIFRHSDSFWKFSLNFTVAHPHTLFSYLESSMDDTLTSTATVQCLYCSLCENQADRWRSEGKDLPVTWRAITERRPGVSERHAPSMAGLERAYFRWTATRRDGITFGIVRGPYGPHGVDPGVLPDLWMNLAIRHLQKQEQII